MQFHSLTKFLPLLFLASLISCGDSESESNYTRTVTKLDEYRETVIITNEQGLMIDSATYVDGKIEGIRMKLDESDSIHYFHQYVDGVLEGEQYGFYVSGQPYFHGARKAGNQLKEWTFYHPNGVVGSYEYFDDAGKRLYLRKYDVNGKVTTSIGEGIFTFDRVPQDSTFAPGEYRAEITCAQPPNAQILMFCGDTVSDQMYYLEVKNNRAIYSEIFIESGNYDRVFVWGCEDTISDLQTKSKLERTIAVLVDSSALNANNGN